MASWVALERDDIIARPLLDGHGSKERLLKTRGQQMSLSSRIARKKIKR